jgi:hypothetical protein
MPRRLEVAYRATDYVVDAAGGAFTLHVDEPSAALAALQARHGVQCSAFIGAWNPGSVPAGAADNDVAHRRLLALVRAAGHALIEGWGSDPKGAWPAERSVLVLGITARAARRLAAGCGQKALLYAGTDAVPRLVWIDQPIGR